MARDIYVDCIHREPSASLEAVRKHLQILRPGASCVVVLSDDPDALGLIEAWGDRLGLPCTVLAHRSYWSLRLFLLPDRFGELPPAARQEAALAHQAA